MAFLVKDLHVFSGEKEIIKGISLTVPQGKIAVIMGPNGSGKSSLCGALMGNPAFRATGSVRLGKDELLALPPDERARKGLFLAFQEPEELEGVKASAFVRKVLAKKDGTRPGGTGPQNMEDMVKSYEKIAETAEKLHLEKGFVSREMNVGFSGGEKKRMELLQMLAFKPKAVVLDEIDSGLDVDGIRIVAKAIGEFQDGRRILLIITHYPRILKYLKPDAVHVLVGGRIVRSGSAKLAHEIEKHGYSQFKGTENVRRKQD